MRPSTIAAVLAVVALLAAGCGGGEETAPTPQPSPTAGATATPPPPPSPSTDTAPDPTAAPQPTTDPTSEVPANPTTEPAPDPDPEPEPDPQTVNVSIVDFDYEPAARSINVGDTVAWSHDGDIAHTVTFSSGGPDSGTLNSGDTFDVTFDRAGTFTYRCLFHSQMQGTITVG